MEKSTEEEMGMQEKKSEKNINDNIGNTDKSRDEKWNSTVSEIEKTADYEGYGIDKEIKEAVVALNVFGINTGQSCEGHIDSGMSAPWIRIEAPNEPEERFVGQNVIFEKVAKKYNMPVDEAKRMYNMDAYWEAFNECVKNEETKEYQDWREESEKLLYLTKEILEDFYKNRQVPENVKIKLDTQSVEEMAGGSFEIFNGGDDYRKINDAELSEKEKAELGGRIETYRKEMRSFADFLKDKFFKEGEGYINDKRNKAQNNFDQEKVRKIMEMINSTDWKDFWKKEDLDSPARKDIFPNGEDDGMSDDEVIEALNKYFEKQGSNLFNMTGINSSEFPEIIDRDIRDVCVKLNQLPFLKTREGCGGHDKDRNKENSDIGYSDVYLIIYAEKENLEFHKFAGKVKENIERLRKQDFPGIENIFIIEGDEAEWPIKTPKIGMYDYRMRIIPTREWCKRNGKKYIERPEKLDAYDDWCKKNGLKYSDDDNSESRLKWEKAKKEWREKMEEFGKEYGEYFRSDEARKIRDEFFKVFNYEK